jgi:hypothetical protein
MTSTEAMAGHLEASVPRWRPWLGRALSALPILAMLASAAMKLSGQPQVLELFSGKYGFPRHLLPVIGVLELTCAALYAIPATSVIGAVLVSAYFGGAVVTHVRVGEAFAVPVLLGVLAWAGLYLRDARFRALVPLRRTADRT